jgi:uncharacterized circularly permuted ATP-grasp superfamily protein/uncharacterized alpha-E superfamily protein
MSNFAEYHPPSGNVFDEAIGPDRALRSAWRGVATALASLGAGGLAALRRDAARLIESQAATHLLHEDPEAARPWTLDPVPVIITSHEWSTLQAGVAQRARLADALVRDLYGPQTVFSSAAMPVEAIAAQPGFLWGMAGAGGAHESKSPAVVIYGADLVRTRDGVWRVLRDATDAPAGIGFAMINRSALARLLPEPFRALGVERLAPFGATCRSALAELSPSGRSSARVVVLTPGVHHDAYVEHAHLAAAFGYHLAEVPDLLVRDGRAWLRSIDGLEPIDVVLRRVEDSVADPLLSGGSGGVANLAAAVRAGAVGMANRIGSGIAGSIAIQSFTETTCSALLGERLKLASLPTIWCGDLDRRAEVVANLDDFVLHDTAAADRSISTVFGDELEDRGRDRWIARLASTPEQIVAQQKVEFATTPVLGTNGQLQPGTVVLRVMAVVHPGGAVDVMPGAVARVLDPTRPIMTQPRGDAKDVWVVAGPGRQGTGDGIALALSSVDLRTSLPTRAAEALSWVGRYAEQAESVARFASIVLARFVEDPSIVTADGGGWRRAMRNGLLTARRLPATDELDDVAVSPDEALLGCVEAALLGRGGFIDALTGLDRAVASSRQYLSRTTWRVLRDLAAEARALTGVGVRGSCATIAERLDRAVVDLAAFSGLVAESTVRGPAWHFLDLGRRYERALGVIGMVESMLATHVDSVGTDPVLDTVLEACESLVAYRRRYRSDAVLSSVLDLLVSDDTNPRSVQFQLDRLRDHVYALPPRADRARLIDLVDLAASAVIERWDDDTIVGGRRNGVDRFVVAARGPLLTIGDELAGVWFADPPMHRLGREV